MCGCVHMNVIAHGDQRHQISPRAKVKVIVSHLTLLLGTELRSPDKAVLTLDD